MSNWNQNQYIQPDSEGTNFGAQAHGQPQFGSSSSTTTSGATQPTDGNGFFSSFSSFVTPKVDLSNTFKPFTTNTDWSNGNNKIKERQYAGGDTLDEPVWHTLKRDLSQIGKRLAIVVWPMQLSLLAKQQQLRFVEFAVNNGVQLPQLILNNRRVSVDQNANDDDDDDVVAENGTTIDDPATELIKNNLDWDLWGPLIFLLVYSVALGLAAPNNQTNQVFSGTFSFVWLFSIVIGLNIQLLGGNISFMSAISASGYSLFPIVVGSLLCSLLIKWKLIRLVMMIVLCAWSIYSGILSLKCSGVLPGKVLLAVYPVGLMYAVLAWLCVIT